VVEVKKFLGRCAGDDTAGFEQDNARREEQGFAQIVCDENDGFTEAPGKGAEFALQLGAGDRVERAEGLIHEQDGGIGGEGPGDSNALALASGEFTRPTMREFAWVEADELEHFLDTGGDAGRIPPFQIGNESDIFSNREMGEEPGVLDDVTDASPETGKIAIASRAAFDQDLPFRGK